MGYQHNKGRLQKVINCLKKKSFIVIMSWIKKYLQQKDNIYNQCLNIQQIRSLISSFPAQINNSRSLEKKQAQFLNETCSNVNVRKTKIKTLD